MVRDQRGRPAEGGQSLNPLERSAPWRFLRFLRARTRERRRIDRIASENLDAHKPTLLVVDHHFSNEIKSMRQSGAFADFQLVVVDSFDLFNRNLWYFPPKVWYAQDPYDGPAYARARERSQRAGGRNLARLRSKVNLVAIVTPSDSFYWLRGTILAARQMGIPTFTFDKEGTISPAGFQTDTVKIREHFPPISDRYYVWSDRQRDFWVQAGAPKERVRVLGSLRTDLYVNMPPAQKTKILLYDFDPSAYALMIPPEDRAGMPDGWAPLKREIHAVMLDRMKAHPSIPFTVKCHPQQTDVAAVQATFERPDLPNVRVVTGSRKVDELTAEHSIAFGFQTTALLEVALTTRPAVYCGWGPLHEAMRRHLVPLMEPGFGIHQSPDAQTLARFIDDHVAGRPLPKIDRSRLETFFHRPDGRVAERYHAALVQDLAGPRVTS